MQCCRTVPLSGDAIAGVSKVMSVSFTVWTILESFTKVIKYIYGDVNTESPESQFSWPRSIPCSCSVVCCYGSGYFCIACHTAAGLNRLTGAGVFFPLSSAQAPQIL